MTRLTRLLIIAFAVMLTASLALAGPAGKTTEARIRDAAAPQTLELRVQPWHLLQHDGAELYRELCASCHGIEGAGSEWAAEALPVPAPALTDLQATGVPREHWTYVIRSGCEDSHHWGPNSTATMPCWQRIFRQSLGNEASALLVSKKLVDYLESIQQ